MSSCFTFCFDNTNIDSIVHLTIPNNLQCGPKYPIESLSCYFENSCTAYVFSEVLWTVKIHQLHALTLSCHSTTLLTSEGDLFLIILTLLLTLCGLTSQKTNQGGLGHSGLVHEEAHPCFPNFV